MKKDIQACIDYGFSRYLLYKTNFKKL